MNKKERPYEFLFHSFIANLPLNGGYREHFKEFWKNVNKEYDKEIKRLKK